MAAPLLETGPDYQPGDKYRVWDKGINISPKRKLDPFEGNSYSSNRYVYILTNWCVCFRLMELNELLKLRSKRADVFPRAGPFNLTDRPSVRRPSFSLYQIDLGQATATRRTDQPRGTWFERIRQILQTQSFERADHHAKLGIWDVLCSPILNSGLPESREDLISMGMFPDRNGPRRGV